MYWLGVRHAKSNSDNGDLYPDSDMVDCTCFELCLIYRRLSSLHKLYVEALGCQVEGEDVQDILMCLQSASPSDVIHHIRMFNECNILPWGKG